MNNWPFDDPEDVVTITLTQIMNDGHPILYVSHDADDGTWQFLTGDQVEMSDAMVVTLRSIFQFDPSIGELADLPLGWCAERSAVGMPWQRTSK
jgi:hypothetical protein